MNTEICLRPIKRFFSVPYWALRERMVKVRVWLGDAAKAFVMLIILRPAADYLPASWAFSLARLFGKLKAMLPFYGFETLRLVKRTFATDSRQARQLAGACMSRHYLDFLAMRRIIRGRENIQERPIIEINQDNIENLRRSGASYIVATGHFNRYAHATLCLSRIVPQRTICVANPPIPKSLHPHNVWLRAHYGQMLQVFQCLRPDVEFLNPGHSGLFKELVRALKRPGTALQIYVDAPWDSQRTGGFSRPFAGKKKSGFATGAARLARLTQCPIVLCLPYMDERGQVILDWARLIQPPDSQDSEADIINTNLLLDDIERVIGMRPDQYVMDVLGERKWNSQLQRWE